MCFYQILKQEFDHFFLSLGSRFSKASRCWGPAGEGKVWIRRKVGFSFQQRLAWLAGWTDVGMDGWRQTALWGNVFFQFDKRATFAGHNQIQTSTVNPVAAAERLWTGGGQSVGILALTSPRRRVDGLCAAASRSRDVWQRAHVQKQSWQFPSVSGTLHALGAL